MDYERKFIKYNSKINKYINKMNGGNTFLNRKLTENDYKIDSDEMQKIYNLEGLADNLQNINGIDVAVIDNENLEKMRDNMMDNDHKFYRHILGDKNVFYYNIVLDNSDTNMYPYNDKYYMIRELDNCMMYAMMIYLIRYCKKKNKIYLDGEIKNYIDSIIKMSDNISDNINGMDMCNEYCVEYVKKYNNLYKVLGIVVNENVFDRFNFYYGVDIFNEISIMSLKKSFECVRNIKNVIDLYDEYVHDLYYNDYPDGSLYEYFEKNALTNIVLNNVLKINNLIKTTNNISVVCVNIKSYNFQKSNDYHSNLIICDNNNKTCIRIEPHRKVDYYCRNSVRSAIRKIIPSDFLYIDNILLTESYGLQKMEDVYFSDFEKNYLNNVRGFCVSWCLLFFVIVILNIRRPLHVIAKYISTFGLDFKGVNDMNVINKNIIYYDSDISNQNIYYIGKIEKIGKMVFFNTKNFDFFYNDDYGLVAKSKMYIVMELINKIITKKSDEKIFKFVIDLRENAKLSLQKIFINPYDSLNDVYKKHDEEYIKNKKNIDYCDRRNKIYNKESYNIRKQYVNDIFNDNVKNDMNII